MITTNADIVNYDFYSPSNILVVDRKNPKFSIKVLIGEYQMVDNKIYTKYSLESWVYGVLGLYE